MPTNYIHNSCPETCIDQLDIKHIKIGSGCSSECNDSYQESADQVTSNSKNNSGMFFKNNNNMNKTILVAIVLFTVLGVAEVAHSIWKQVPQAANVISVKSVAKQKVRAKVLPMAKQIQVTVMPVASMHKAVTSATKVDMVKVTAVVNPNLPFESFAVMVSDGVANIRWTDKEPKAVTYMVEKSDDGTNYEIYSVTDGPGTTGIASEQTFNQADRDPGQYYRLLKIIHGGAVYEGNARGVIKSKPADVAEIKAHGNQSIVASIYIGL